jgi:hypothetical protein
VFIERGRVIVSGRPWSPAETALARRLYLAGARVDEIARRLDRSPTSIYRRACSLGLRRRRRTEVDAAFLETVRRLAALGRTDPEIAAELGCDRHTVSGRRKRMGLASNAYGARHRAKIAASAREQCRRWGVANLGAIRSRVFRLRAQQAGWPGDLRPRAVQILDALADRGPLTRRELAKAIGVPWNGTSASLRSRDPGGSYLAYLIARGLVVSLGRVARGVGRGGSSQLYSLSLAAERSPADGRSAEEARRPRSRA